MLMFSPPRAVLQRLQFSFKVFHLNKTITNVNVQSPCWLLQRLQFSLKVLHLNKTITNVNVQSPCWLLQRLQFSLKVLHLNQNHHKCFQMGNLLNIAKARIPLKA